MADLIFMELGFPIILIDPPMIEVRGQRLPDLNFKELQETVFQLLVVKPARLIGDEVRFVRKHLRLRQADLAQVLNMANHSVVSQWESRGEEPTGMGYNTEVLLRVWMAVKSGHGDQLVELLESRLKDLAPRSTRPLEVTLSQAA